MCDDYYETDLIISSAITLKSATGTLGCVTIYGQLANRILHIYDADGAVVWGIQFHGGFSPDVGGAVRVDSCDVEFWECSFYGSHANLEGGGLRYRKGDPGDLRVRLHRQHRRLQRSRPPPHRDRRLGDRL